MLSMYHRDIKRETKGSTEEQRSIRELIICFYNIVRNKFQ
jgi:hypothetical protein